MTSTFCLTGASRSRPTIHRTSTGVRIFLEGVSLSLPWEVSLEIAHEITRLWALERRSRSLEKFPESSLDSPYPTSSIE